MTDARLEFPATQRNRDPILAVLRRVLPERGTVLEVASGSGEHAAYFAAALPGLRWQPSDIEPAHRASVSAWCEGLSNVLPPLDLNALVTPWSLPPMDAVYCANMIHIAPWECALGLLSEAGRCLRAGAPLVLYGPFKVAGQHTAPSNEAFDASLRGRNASWGVRNLDDVAAVAAQQCLALEETVSMPANNLSVIFRKQVDA